LKSSNAEKSVTHKTASTKSTEKAVPSGKWAPPTKEEKKIKIIVLLMELSTIIIIKVNVGVAQTL
jgi:hypothetical protein